MIHGHWRWRGWLALAGLIWLLSTAVPVGAGPPEPTGSHLPITSLQGNGNPSEGCAQALCGTRYVGAGAHILQERDFVEMAAAGVEGIRLYVGQDTLQDPDGTLRYDNWWVIDQALGWAARYRLGIVLDLHFVYGWDGPFYSDPTAVANWQSLWQALARRYHGQPQSVLRAYQLLNEPHPTDGSSTKSRAAADIWNDLVAGLVPLIRAIDPGRPIVVGAAHYSIPEMFYDVANDRPLLRPVNAPNIIYAFHWYHPYPFTVQNSPQTWHDCHGPAYQVDYPGRYSGCAGAQYAGDWDYNRLARLLEPVRRFQQWHQRQLGGPAAIFVSEWDTGWDNQAAYPAQLRLIADEVKLFQASGYTWSWHQWGGSRWGATGCPDPTMLRWISDTTNQPGLATERLRALGLRAFDLPGREDVCP